MFSTKRSKVGAVGIAAVVVAGGTYGIVELSNGDYEVHNVGVNWPHHVFVNADFQVIGADD